MRGALFGWILPAPVKYHPQIVYMFRVEPSCLDHRCKKHFLILDILWNAFPHVGYYCSEKFSWKWAYRVMFVQLYVGILTTNAFDCEFSNSCKQSITHHLNSSCDWSKLKYVYWALNCLHMHFLSSYDFQIIWTTKILFVVFQVTYSTGNLKISVDRDNINTQHSLSADKGIA